MGSGNERRSSVQFEPSKFAVQREVLRESAGGCRQTTPLRPTAPLVPTNVPSRPAKRHWVASSKFIGVFKSFPRFEPLHYVTAELRLTERQTKRQNASDWLASLNAVGICTFFLSFDPICIA